MSFTLIKSGVNFDFVGKRKLVCSISAIIILVCLAVMLVKGGPKLGIDFAGGTIVQIQFEKPVEDEKIKKSLSIAALPEITTQRFGDNGLDFLLRFSSLDADQNLRQIIIETLEKDFPGNKVSIQRLELVGPKVGADLTNSALQALYYATLLIAVYISGRFEQKWMAAGIMAACLWGGMYILGFTDIGMGWQVCFSLVLVVIICWRLKLNFALGAVVGLLYDVIITLGILILLGKQIDLNIVAAILTLVGYSLNDTIIIYDRIREVLRKNPDLPLGEIINKSANQTLSRTIITSGTTFIATLALFIFGGGVIHDFALAMLIGLVVGTISSVYVASSILMLLGKTDDYMHEEAEDYIRPDEHGIV